MDLVHGEANWSGASKDLAGSVERMTRAVSGGVSSLHYDRDARPVCVLAHQEGITASSSASYRRNESLDIVHNLSIHDAQPVRRLLSIDGAAYRALTTTDVIAELYFRDGAHAFDNLVGEGTFALWDRARRRLILWRDALGTSPLYYHHRPGERIVFSSDLRSLAAHPDVPARLDLEFARSVLENGWFHHPTRTLRQDVTKLPSGHVLSVDDRRYDLRRYWQPDQLPERRHRSRTDYVDELRELLTSSIEARIPDDPSTVACHLTGGLDSSTISVLAQQAVNGRGATLRGISWAPPEELVTSVSPDERPLARLVARSAGIQLHFTTPSVSDQMHGISADQSLTPCTTLQWERTASRAAAAAGITTILSGWGGDELAGFNGRGFFADLARRGRWVRLGSELRLQHANVGIPIVGALRGSVVMPLLSDSALRRLRPQLVPETILPGGLRPDFAAAVQGVEAVEHADLRTRPGVRRMQLMLLSSGHMPYRAESWFSHGTDVGIRYSYPLLDRRIVEFALSAPEDLFFLDGWKRWLFREAAVGILPEAARLNPHKVDASASEGTRSTAHEVNRLHRLALLGRRSNPFIDVDKALDPGTTTSPLEKSALWLAFLTEMPYG